jgi:hypothetical protein
VVSASICDGNARVQQLMPCTPLDGGAIGQGIREGTCGSPYTSRLDCPNGSVCSGGDCLTRVAAPMRSCLMASDCFEPPRGCVGVYDQIIFSDPTCDDGQCHWKETIDTCFSNMCDWCMHGHCDLASGQCVPYAGGPASQMIAVPQPATPAAQTCSKSIECTQPPPTCLDDSIVSYVQPACRASACAWEMALSQCAASETCVGGACVPR